MDNLAVTFTSIWEADTFYDAGDEVLAPNPATSLLMI